MGRRDGATLVVRQSSFVVADKPDEKDNAAGGMPPGRMGGMGGMGGMGM